MSYAEVVEPGLLTPPVSDGGFPLCDDASVSAKAETVCFERRMGDTELSYFLPSRQSGVNDMCVCPCCGILRATHSLAKGTSTSDSMLPNTSSRVRGYVQYGPFYA